jgi:DNA-binding response OmpR family regulator
MQVGQASKAAMDKAVILVVDDDARVRHMLCWALEDEGWMVKAAADGPQALAWLGSHRPDLVLLDVGPPLVDGPVVAREVRSCYGNDIPIVVITADAGGSARARNLGAIATFQKPFDVDLLMAAVQHALKST